MCINFEAKTQDRVLHLGKWVRVHSAQSLKGFKQEGLRSTGQAPSQPCWIGYSRGRVCPAELLCGSTKKKKEKEKVAAPHLKPANILSEQSSISWVCWAARNYKILDFSLLISSRGFQLRLGMLSSCFWIGRFWSHYTLWTRRMPPMRFLPGVVDRSAAGGARTWAEGQTAP